MQPISAPFTEKPGPKGPLSCETPEDCSSLFFDDNLLQYIADQTNTYAQKKLAAMQVEMIIIHELDALHVKTYPIECCKYHVDPYTGMKGFLAVILNMEIIQLQDQKDYWSTHHTTNPSFFRSVFSRDCFFQIFGTLYVGDPDSTTKKGKIQPFIDRLCAAFEAAHTPDA